MPVVTNLVESEDGELYRLEIRNGEKVFTQSLHEPCSNGQREEGRVNLTVNVSAVEALVTSEQIAKRKPHISKRHPKSAPKEEKCWKLRG